MDCSDLFRLHEKVLYLGAEFEILEFIKEEVLLSPKFKGGSTLLVKTFHIRKIRS